MANDYDTTAKNPMLDHLATLITRAALHSGDPGTGADNELSGGTPAYARQPVTWAAASGGVMDETSSPVFDIPPGSTVSWLSLWNTAGSTRYAKKNITDEVFANQGTYTLSDLDLDLNDP